MCCLELPVFLIMEIIGVCYESKAKHVNALLWAEGGVRVRDCYSSSVPELTAVPKGRTIHDETFVNRRAFNDDIRANHAKS